MEKIKVLNSNQFKILLAIMMVVNHIHYFFEFTGKIPKSFELIGYCVAPCFLLLMIDGFQLTSNRRNYYLRLWMIAAMMSLVLWAIKYLGFAQRCDGFVPLNNIISNFLVLFVLMLGVETIKAKEYIKGGLIFIAPIIWGCSLSFLSRYILQTRAPLELISSVVFPNFLWILDGGTPYLLTGLVAYICRKNRYIQVITSCIAFYIFYIVYEIIIFNLNGIQFGMDIFLDNVAIFAALGFLPVLFYNGKKGKGSGRFFYYFYPLHIYALYAISGIVYEMINPGDNQIEKVTIPMVGVLVVFSVVFFIKDYFLINKKIVQH